MGLWPQQWLRFFPFGGIWQERAKYHLFAGAGGNAGYKYFGEEIIVETKGMAVVFPVGAVAGVVCVAAGSAGASRAVGSSVPRGNAHGEGKLLTAYSPGAQTHTFCASLYPSSASESQSQNGLGWEGF